jgi:hypothetical protein
VGKGLSKEKGKAIGYAANHMGYWTEKYATLTSFIQEATEIADLLAKKPKRARKIAFTVEELRQRIATSLDFAMKELRDIERELGPIEGVTDFLCSLIEDYKRKADKRRFEDIVEDWLDDAYTVAEQCSGLFAKTLLTKVVLPKLGL